MSEEGLLEEDDIWEYRSIRKPKLQSQNDAAVCMQDGKQSRGGGGKSKKSGQKKTESTQKNTDMATKSKQGQKRQSIPALAPEQNINNPKRDLIVSSQRTTKSPAKQSSKKQSPPIPRTVHDGHCPNCQMPFSVLLVQTPRWHVDECLDAPGHAEKECPEGLLCSNTIPSHYKRYSHFQLARRRAVDDISSAQLCAQDKQLTCFGASGSDSPHGGTTHLVKPAGNVQRSLLVPDSSDCTISYSPLDSDYEATEVNIKHSRKRLFHTQPLENEHTEEEDHHLGAWQDVEKHVQGMANGFNSSKVGDVLKQNGAQHEKWTSPCHPDSVSKQDPGSQPGLTYDPSASLPFSPSESGKIKEEPDWPEFSTPVSETGDWDTKYIEAACWFSSGLPSSAVFPAVKVEAEEKMPYQSLRSSALPESRSGFRCKEELCGSSPFGSSGALSVRASDFAVSQSSAVKQETLPSSQAVVVPVLGVPANKVSSVCVANSSVSAVPSKALKQMDIGVFFGLKPKAKEEKGLGVNLSQKVQSASSGGSPKGKGPGQRKRKAEGSVGDADTAQEAPHRNGIPAKATGNRHQGWKKRFRESDATDGEKGKKQCPFYKKIPGTGFTVDAFQFGRIEGCTAYFLTHFHSDHYGGLTKKFQCPIYCSKITGNLVRSKLQVEERFIHTLPMDTECVVDGIKVVLLEANHCPGAVLLLFCLPNGTAVLHTGDFRADPSMEQYPALMGCKVHTLYLDTTYCSPEYTFPPQQEAIHFAVNAAFEMVTLYPRTLVVCGTYSIGKERVFLAIADVLGCKVSVSQDKYKTLQCLESKHIDSLITTDWNSTGLHVLPMMQVNCKGLLSHLNKFSGRYDRVLAFKPTGWTYSDGSASVADIKPTVRGKITLYGIPYSEHSSYLEMKRFVQWLKPQKIIPTVNVGDWKSRSTMERYFSEWMTEPAPRRAAHS